MPDLSRLINVENSTSNFCQSVHVCFREKDKKAMVITKHYTQTRKSLKQGTKLATLASLKTNWQVYTFVFVSVYYFGSFVQKVVFFVRCNSVFLV